MKPEVKREIISLCQVLTLAGLVENPYPMVDRRQELKWERAGRAESYPSFAKIMDGGQRKRLHGSNCSPYTDP